VHRVAHLLLATVVAVTAVGCGDDNSTDESVDSGSGGGTSGSTTLTVETRPSSIDPQYPAVIDATAVPGDGGWTFAVTISSPYDSPERYADAWRIVGPDGTVFGVRELSHDHAGEQPFMRSLSGVSIPGDVVAVTIEGRDLANGWGGRTLELTLDRQTSGS
jgi:hypothetical protein